MGMENKKLFLAFLAFVLLGSVLEVQSAPFSTWQIHDFFKLSLYRRDTIDPNDTFLTNCTTDSVVNLYLKDFMKDQWQCHLPDCLSRKTDLRPNFLQLSNVSTLEFLVAPFMDLLYNQPNCPDKLRLAIEGVSQFLQEVPSTPIEVRIVETTQKLESYGNSSSCVRNQRVFLNLVIPDFCNSTCLGFCFQDFVNLNHLNRAVSAFQLRNLRRAIDSTIANILQEKNWILSSFGKDTSAVPFIEEAGDHKLLQDCVRDHSLLHDTFFAQRLKLPSA